MWGTGCQVYWIRMASMIQRQCATCHRQGLSSQLATSAMPSQCTCVRGWALYPGGEAVWLASRQGCPKLGPSASRVCWHTATDLTVLRRCEHVHVARAGWQSRTWSVMSFFASPFLLLLTEFPGHSNRSSLPPPSLTTALCWQCEQWQCPRRELGALKTEIIRWLKLMLGMSKWLRAETQLKRTSGHVEKMLPWHKALQRVGEFRKSTVSPALPKVPSTEGRW